MLSAKLHASAHVCAMRIHVVQESRLRIRQFIPIFDAQPVHRSHMVKYAIWIMHQTSVSPKTLKHHIVWWRRSSWARCAFCEQKTMCYFWSVHRLCTKCVCSAKRCSASVQLYSRMNSPTEWRHSIHRRETFIQPDELAALETSLCDWLAGGCLFRGELANFKFELAAVGRAYWATECWMLCTNTRTV